MLNECFRRVPSHEVDPARRRAVQKVVDFVRQDLDLPEISLEWIAREDPVRGLRRNLQALARGNEGPTPTFTFESCGHVEGLCVTAGDQTPRVILLASLSIKTLQETVAHELYHIEQRRTVGLVQHPPAEIEDMAPEDLAIERAAWEYALDAMARYRRSRPCIVVTPIAPGGSGSGS